MTQVASAPTPTPWLMRTTLKRLLRSYVEQGLNATPSGSGSKRSAHTLPRLEGALHYWEQQAAELVLFCTVTALGLVRLVGQPKHPLFWTRFASSRV